MQSLEPRVRKQNRAKIFKDSLSLNTVNSTLSSVQSDFNDLKTDVNGIKTNIEQLTLSVKNSFIRMGDERN